MASRRQRTEAITMAPPSEAPIVAMPNGGEALGLSMVMSPEQAKSQLVKLQAFVRDVMVVGEDFGKIPGTGKPTLFQPGAQKLAELYGIAHRFEYDDSTVRDWTQMFFYFSIRTVLTSRRDGSFIGEGLGSCNSRESKYAFRWAFESELPAGVDRGKLDKQIRRSKKNGKEYWVWKLPNDDVGSIVNTLEKMAAKRSYIHAIIAATRSSGIFTQDVEDLPKAAIHMDAELEDDGKETPSVQKDFARLASALELCTTEAELREVSREVQKLKEGGQLDARAMAELKKIRDGAFGKLRRAEGQRQVDATGPLPEGWGGDAAPAEAKLEGDDLGGRM